MNVFSTGFVTLFGLILAFILLVAWPCDGEFPCPFKRWLTNVSIYYGTISGIIALIMILGYLVKLIGEVL